MSSNVIVVDDDKNTIKAIQRVFRKEPFVILSAESGEEALELLQRYETDVIVVDQNMPQMKGLEVLSLAKEVSPDTVRIMLTGEADLSIAIEAINHGEIFRFFTKPYNEIELGMALRHAIHHKNLYGHSRNALEVLKMQSAYIESIEKEHPGITHVERDQFGAVVLSESRSDLEELIIELDEELKHYGKVS